MIEVCATHGTTVCLLKPHLNAVVMKFVVAGFQDSDELRGTLIDHRRGNSIF